jgi:hypothetical protein
MPDFLRAELAGYLNDVASAIVPVSWAETIYLLRRLLDLYYDEHGTDITLRQLATHYPSIGGM